MKLSDTGKQSYEESVAADRRAAEAGRRKAAQERDEPYQPGDYEEMQEGIPPPWDEVEGHVFLDEGDGEIGA